MVVPINVMVINDSEYLINLLTELISSNQIHVISTARDGKEGLRRIERCRPDVILLDLEMPNMDGLTFLENLMKNNCIPVIVVSAYSQKETHLVFDSLELGAVDFIPIPQDKPDRISHLKDTLISKINTAASINQNSLKHWIIPRRPSVKKHDASTDASSKVVIIGSSTGGLRILNNIMTELPIDLEVGLLIIQHIPNSFTASFVERLNDISRLSVKEAHDGDVIKVGEAMVAPGDYHMLVNSNKSVTLNQSPRRLGVRPSINMTMVTASEVFEHNTVGVILSGMGQDGAFGMKTIKKRGGVTIAQDESSSVIFGMAKAANELCVVDKLISAEKIPQAIIEAIREKS